MNAWIFSRATISDGLGLEQCAFCRGKGGCSARRGEPCRQSRNACDHAAVPGESSGSHPGERNPGDGRGELMSMPWYAGLYPLSPPGSGFGSGFSPVKKLNELSNCSAFTALLSNSKLDSGPRGEFDCFTHFASPDPDPDDTKSES
jgi:hypothetical protein